MGGRAIPNEDLVNFSNWLSLTFRPKDGDWFNLMAVEILSYRQELHLKSGTLVRKVPSRDKQGRKTIAISRRLVHMGRPYLAAIETCITPKNWSGKIRTKSELDGPVIKLIRCHPFCKGSRIPCRTKA
ncbi:MAG: hypothetical protein QF619_14140 [Candidatus Binatia bacterium]|jgi:alpha,alpha-trehalase|nr:hypothetical protein [Candidatus Binatia bacterium]